MPAGAELYLFGADCASAYGPFTANDNKEHRQLWTPAVDGEEVVLYLTAPAATSDQIVLSLTSVNRGFRDAGALLRSSNDAYSCMVDVVCPDNSQWRDEIRSVATVTSSGFGGCTGFLVNNTANDRTPYFMSAHHCGITEESAPSALVRWNHQATECDGRRDGPSDQYQSGARFLAGNATSDFVLLELDDPPDPEWNVRWAGWDSSDAVPTSAVGIHHPSGRLKRINFDFEPLQLVLGLFLNSIRRDVLVVDDWEIGATRPGSSGSPLFNQDHRVVGQLWGGASACGNSAQDYYGWFHRSWADGLEPWLDPVGSGATVIDGIDGCDAPVVVPGAEVDLVDPGSTRMFTSSVSGGTPPYRYAWDFNADGAVDSDESATSHTYVTRFSGAASVRVTDSLNCARTERVHVEADVLPSYSFTDTEYEWIHTGSEVTSFHRRSVRPRSIPFGFPFYGKDYYSVSIGANGTLTFEELFFFPVDPPPPIPAETVSETDTMIAALWDDFDPDAGGMVREGVVGEAPNRKYVITWDDVPLYSDGAEGPRHSFQIVLEESGHIKFVYRDVPSAGASATVGTQDSPVFGQQYSHNEAVLHSGQAILLSTCPVSPVVTIDASAAAPELEVPVEFTADVTGATPPYAYLWDFDGDGFVDSQEPSPSHTYMEYYEGPVRLTVSNVGCEVTAQFDIEAGQRTDYGFFGGRPFDWVDIAATTTSTRPSSRRGPSWSLLSVTPRPRKAAPCPPVLPP